MKKIIGISLMLIGFATMSFILPTKNTATSQLEIAKDDVGIKFQSITYAEALKLSEKTGKPIFIDCYTVWCGPCNMLSNSTFKDKAVAEFFNENFINIKVEMEKDADGPELARLFKVRAYPTLLFINGKGEVIKQSLGFVTDKQLLEVAKATI